MMASGTTLSETRTLTQADFDRFALISGDDNPIHVNPAFSESTRFGRTVSHGMLLYSVFWGLLQRHLPFTRQHAQTLMFPNPAFADEPILFTVRVDEREASRAVVSLRAARVADQQILCEGQAILETREDRP